MGTPKVNYSDAVSNQVKLIAKLQGKKNAIDTRYEYDKLGQLLSDIYAGKLDKNTIEQDATYVKGLQIEYEKRYLGEPAGNSGSAEPTPAKQSIKDDKKQPKAGESETDKTESLKPQKPVTRKGKPVEKTMPEKPQGPTNEQPRKNDDRLPEEIPAKKNPFQPKPDKPQPKPRTPDRPNVSTTNKGNNDARDNGIIVTGDNNTINIGAQEAVGTGDAAKEAEEAKKAKEAAKILDESKKNYTAAFAEGKQVAKDLIGYTTTEEKQNAVRNIMKQSPETIMGFISGFNENDTVLGVKYGVGGLIDQIDNEYGWTKAEKEETFKKIISTTLAWAEKAGFENNSDYLALSDIAKHLNAGKKIDTEVADMLVKELVSRGMAKAGI